MKNIIQEEYLHDFLCECISSKVEEPNQLTQMLKWIGYLEQKEYLISKTTSCEILDCEDIEIRSIQEKESVIIVDCALSYIMQTIIDEAFIWRVQATAECTVAIPDSDYYDWNMIKDNMSSREAILKHKDIIEYRNIAYKDVECDCLYR